jgi:aryl-alcohol dehydrogenase-like predicted oxidoreductase
MPLLGRTDLDIFPLCLGGNVFGWTANEQESFAILDAYAAAGGNFIDTADAYSAWVPGHVGGESETIIGRWMAARRLRHKMIIATKVGRCPGRLGLAPNNIRAGAEASLKRLGVDRIDLYYAHADDPATPIEQSLREFDALVREGKLRHVAASNYTAARLAEALAISTHEKLTRYVALQPHYNLVVRDEYEGPLADLCAREDVSCLPYFALAKGFLTGKYRSGVAVQSARAKGAQAYQDERGQRVLAALDEIAAAHDTSVAAVSLAWLLEQPTVAAPIASARTVAQLNDLLPMATLKLTPDEIHRLETASQPSVRPH